jgi:hypothetical protein
LVFSILIFFICHIDAELDAMKGAAEMQHQDKQAHIKFLEYAERGFFLLKVIWI